MGKFILNDSDVVGVVANDAGAANLILGWVKNNKKLKYFFCVSGPAKKIFQDANLLEECLGLDTLIRLCNVIITGTSYRSVLEHNARYKGKLSNIKSIGVIDHWVNYKRRFVRNGLEILPDLIWVFDDYAEKMAKSIFEKVPIEKQKNYYLEDIVSKIKSIEKKEHDFTCKILYILEPIRGKGAKHEKPFEFKVLDFFTSKINHLKSRDSIEIRLRTHPSEIKSKYNEWIKNQELFISLSFDSCLEEDIAWADIVVGYESFALVIASACDKRCLSSKLPNEENSRLMIKNLEYLRDLN